MIATDTNVALEVSENVVKFDLASLEESFGKFDTSW
jgi:hypothetical protein